MTKQQIKDLVAAKIAGQGTMVDAGGGLPTILNEIIDLLPEGGGNEPIIVEGEISSSGQYSGVRIFTPTSADFDEVSAAFNSGTPVYLKGTADAPTQLLVAEYVNDDAGNGVYLGAFYMNISSEAIDMVAWIKS